jgi:hypothetical protein
MAKIMKVINELSTRVLVVRSVQGDDRHSKPVLCTFKKCIHLIQKEGEKHGNLLYSASKSTRALGPALLHID